jgi:sugar lactone lactonase YvrE
VGWPNAGRSAGRKRPAESGEYLGRVSFDGSADAIAVGPDGGLVVVSSERILRLSSDGSPLYDNASIAESTLGGSIFINGAAADGSGNVFVIDTFETAIFKFNSQGAFNDQLGVTGEGPGFLDAAPDAITTDRFGRIYVADWDGIEVFEPGGGYAGFIDLVGAIFGMTTTIDDELFILERNYGQLYKLKLRNPE